MGFTVFALIFGLLVLLCFILTDLNSLVYLNTELLIE